MRYEIKLYFDGTQFIAEVQLPDRLVTANGHTPDDALGQIGGTLLGIEDVRATGDAHDNVQPA